ncbi:MAG TPA: adenylate/guanylate cyclase domain-containing protein, partial [Acidimicrobiia bacterium]
GINTGYCTVGNFGSEERLDYTIVGGQVNAASRLEVTAEPDQILVSHQTWALIKDAMRCEPVGEIKVKGIAHPLLTYEVVGAIDADATLAAGSTEQ